MHAHSTSPEDLLLQARFEDTSLPPVEFSHRAHVLLAYTLLARYGFDAALERLRTGVGAYLCAHGIDAGKYHETLTHAWLLAVCHFMSRTTASVSGADFVARNPLLLDSRIMLTHYSATRLFSAVARERFLAPDIEPIPRDGVPAAGRRAL